jgi:hypothetical protein
VNGSAWQAPKPVVNRWGEAAIVSLSVYVRELPKRHVKPPTSEYRVIRSRLESRRGSNAQGLRTEHRIYVYEMSNQK